MGTRSMIAIQNPYSKDVRAVYCHWDGYLEHNGSILNKHYATSSKVNNLIALGGLSSLRPELGVKHAFSSMELPKDQREAHEEAVKDMCTFYTRDRGETAPYKHFGTVKEAVAYYDGSWCEYFYLFKYDDTLESGKWYYRTRENGRWKRLATALKRCDQKDLA